MHVDVQNRQHLRSYCELNSLLRSRFESNAFKPLQLHHRLRDGSNLLVQIELRYLVSLALAGVGDIHAHFRSSACQYLRRLHAQVIEPERCITQPIPKRKEGLASAELIASVVGWFVVIEVRQVAHRMRECDGQLAAGIHIAEDHFSRARSTFLAKIPALKNRGDLFSDVVDRQRPPVDQQHHRRRSGFDHRLHQIVLRAQQVK